MSCIFCQIVEGKIPSTKVFESPDVLGFKEIQPQAPIHYLFIPKKHYESLVEVPQNEMAVFDKIFGAIKSVTEKEGFAQTGFRTVMNTNRQGGQSVFHFHVMAGTQMGGNLTGI